MLLTYLAQDSICDWTRVVLMVWGSAQALVVYIDEHECKSSKDLKSCILFACTGCSRFHQRLPYMLDVWYVYLHLWVLWLWSRGMPSKHGYLCQNSSMSRPTSLIRGFCQIIGGSDINNRSNEENIWSSDPEIYLLVNVYKKLWEITMLSMGKLTVSIVMFDSKL